MDTVKKLTGLTVALFCVLLVASAGQFCVNADLKWYSSLIKPFFMPTPLGFTFTVTVVYALCIAVITRLVVGKRFFPSLTVLALTGVLAVLFLFVVFRLRNLYGGVVVAVALFLLSAALEVRFVVKDWVLAAVYAPVALFNAFCLVLTSVLAMTN